MLKYVAAAAVMLVGGSALAAPGGASGAYCVAKGGHVEVRTPYYGTNGPGSLQLAGPQPFCHFAAKNGSSIHLLLTTLYTKKPSLAALAYYAAPAFQGANCKGSPGSCYCSQLGGTDLFGGITAAGGGWQWQHNTADVLDACIFPDLSSIDSYGLFYHSAGIIRGIDLSTVLRYPNPY